MHNLTQSRGSGEVFLSIFCGAKVVKRLKSIAFFCALPIIITFNVYGHIQKRNKEDEIVGVVVMVRWMVQKGKVVHDHHGKGGAR